VSIQLGDPVRCSPTIEHGQEANNSGNTILTGPLDIPALDVTDLGGEYTWEWDDSNLVSADFSEMGTNEHCPSPCSSPFVPLMTPSSDRTSWEQRRLSPSGLSIPMMPTSAVRSLIRRPRLHANAQRVSSLILHTLKSYPLMMMRHETLPPFIHPGPILSDIANHHMEPLTNCMNLSHVINSGVQGSRKLFWRNVRLECERLLHEVC